MYGIFIGIDKYLVLYRTSEAEMSSNPLAFAQASLESVKIDLSESAKFMLVISIFLLRRQISEMAKSSVSLPSH